MTMLNLPHFDKYFGDDWTQNGVNNFYKKRNGFNPKNVYNQAIPLLEISQHHLLKQILNVTFPENVTSVLANLPDVSLATIELKFLERDLDILDKDISKDDGILNDYKNRLLNPYSYEAARFELFIASLYKIASWDIEFIKRSAQKTCEFIARKGKEEIQVECKQRNQNITDKTYQSLLYDLTSLLFPKLTSFSLPFTIVKLHIIDKKFDKADLCREIVRQIMLNNYNLKFIFLNKVEVEIKFTPRLPDTFLSFLQKDPNYFTLEDSYLACHEKVFLLIDRDVDDNLVTTLLSNLVGKAKTQFKTGSPSIVYLDVGKLPTSVNDLLAKSLMKGFSKRISAIIVAKYQFHVSGQRQIVFTPFPKTFARKNILSDKELATVLGLDGTTGFDTYVDSLMKPESVGYSQ